MSDISEIIRGKGIGARGTCRVAYTLNNTQPVQCTIIGDQPLFYMDYDIDYEDEAPFSSTFEGVFDMGDMHRLEAELKDLKKEIESLDRFAKDFSQGPEIKFSQFLEDARQITAPSRRSVAKREQITEILKKSRLALAYMEFAEQNQVKVELSDAVIDGEYDRRAKTIRINPNLETTDQILLAVRELRRHWQHRQGVLINPLIFDAEKAILINRMQIADLSTSMVRVAWELQLSGYKQAWERVENSSLRDLGHAMAREAYLDFRTLNNGEAMAAIFESWFLSDRCRAEDKKLIQKMLADYGGHMFNLTHGQESLTPSLIAALGSMPYGKNYLASHATTIMNDPIFNEVRDRSNANFLWFIKFERSFRETEQELQSAGVSTEGVRPSAQHTQQDQKNGPSSTNGIIALFPKLNQKELESENNSGFKNDGDKSGKNTKLLRAKPEPSRSKGDGSKKQKSAEIIYLRRWSGD